MTATTEKPRYQVAEVLPALNELNFAIWDACDQIVTAGSIRRKRPTVSDIELVVMPRIRPVEFDLFGAPTKYANMLDRCIQELLADGTLEHRLDKNGHRACGERYKRLRHVATGVPIDLFSVLPPAQFGVLVAIRTGPAEFSQRFVTARSIGGELPNYMLVRDGCLYRHIQGADLPVDKEARRNYPAGWLVEVPTPTEASFFEAIGMPYLKPEARS